MHIKILHKKIVLAFLLVFGFGQVMASHILGGEIFYTHISGNTYKVSLIIYGDCSGQAAAFAGLPNGTPEVEIYNGSSLVSTIYLQPQPGSGINVSPVCPDEAANTTCNNGIYPGVKKFIYASNYTLNTSSANWKFRFTGQFNNNTQAGRSNSITNAVIPGTGSLMSLEATLNNVAVTNNSSPTYTTIPTPFFCINKPQEYNQGAIDSDADSLSFALVPGLVPNGTSSLNVAYVFPYTATAPLGCAPGTFVFNGTTGQLSFTPNVIQDALVVNRVTEYRNGIAVGTSMREMCFIVLNNCNNNPPSGPISNVSNGTLENNTTLKVCMFNGTVSFSIHATDPDGDNITISSQGLPTGAVTSVTANGGTAPTFLFNWNISNVTPGTYVFYLTYADDGCPLTSKQSIAYTIKIREKPALASVVTAPACPGSSNAAITATASGGQSPYSYAFGTGAYGSNNVFSGLTAGTYTIHAKDSASCITDTTITITNPPAMALTLQLIRPLCGFVSNGQATVSVTNGTAPYQYALNSGAFGSSNTFTSLASGSYTLHVKDVNGCTKDTLFSVTDSLAITVQPIITGISCFGNNNGSITVNASGPGAPFSYALGTGTFGTVNVFSNLGPGSYTLHVKDNNGCLKDSTVSLVQPALLAFTLNVTQVLCRDASTGAIIVNATGGTGAYQYAVNTGAFQSSNTFTGLIAGGYTIHLKDANNCTKDTTLTITQPATAITFGGFTITDPTCEGMTDGIVGASAQGGTPPYQFTVNNGTWSTSANLPGLAEGSYIISIRDNNGCRIDTSVTLTGFPHISLDGVTMTQPSCYGRTDGSLTLLASGGRPPFTYSFNSNDSWGNAPVFSDKGAGQYVLRAKDANNCIKDTTVFLSQPEKIIVDTAAVGNDCNGVDNGGVINIEVTGGTMPYQYAWSHNASLNSPTATGLVNGSYSVTVTDAKGCTGNASVEILYNNCCTPFIPNAFSPNGDGANDYYKVEYKGDMDLKEMYIYNRYGQRIFSSSNVNKTWDGTYKGTPVDAGTYFYYVRILCGNRAQKELIFKGDVTLIR